MVEERERENGRENKEGPNRESSASGRSGRAGRSDRAGRSMERPINRSTDRPTSHTSLTLSGSTHPAGPENDSSTPHRSATLACLAEAAARAAVAAAWTEVAHTVLPAVEAEVAALETDPVFGHTETFPLPSMEQIVACGGDWQSPAFSPAEQHLYACLARVRARLAPLGVSMELVAQRVRAVAHDAASFFPGAAASLSARQTRLSARWSGLEARAAQLDLSLVVQRWENVCLHVAEDVGRRCAEIGALLDDGEKEPAAALYRLCAAAVALVQAAHAAGAVRSETVAPAFNAMLVPWRAVSARVSRAPLRPFRVASAAAPGFARAPSVSRVASASPGVGNPEAAKSGKSGQSGLGSSGLGSSGGRSEGSALSPSVASPLPGLDLGLDVDPSPSVPISVKTDRIVDLDIVPGPLLNLQPRETEDVDGALLESSGALLKSGGALLESGGALLEPGFLIQKSSRKKRNQRSGMDISALEEKNGSEKRTSDGNEAAGMNISMKVKIQGTIHETDKTDMYVNKSRSRFDHFDINNSDNVDSSENPDSSDYPDNPDNSDSSDYPDKSHKPYIPVTHSFHSHETTPKHLPSYLPSRIPLIVSNYTSLGLPVIKKKYTHLPTRIASISPSHPVFISPERREIHTPKQTPESRSDSPRLRSPVVFNMSHLTKHSAERSSSLQKSADQMSLRGLRTPDLSTGRSSKLTQSAENPVVKSAERLYSPGTYAKSPRLKPSQLKSPGITLPSTSPERPETSIGSRFDDINLPRSVKEARKAWR
ncbi:hypothetical protein EJF18_40019 [Clavispora lusitaniae]|uniref:Uncharacterized protein n=1 Tax=Clavispora lusitaniae TaxID=36911 RepID=A0ACD0WLQ6_CLALS|nr:hypothetical protein EJF14_40019 [Clavispora lusitaniae]QFZ33661.1 hypothetical protein EJF16_40019 [Clavispora lusitaniae]QFZ39332.1 hypothetical protein EJF15_40019 [Clavispora lusitaniae]QFZ45014.1 hypothetical protein EJF18_40019 [Clavispora lusitaniae]QFZ50691.1 hypothetical protein EJF17_40019 [Clavispora lusitaniae]